MIDHVGIYGSRLAEGLSAFNVGLVEIGTKKEAEVSDNMLNQTTGMNYASRKNPSGVKTLLQKMRFKKRVESSVFAENCVQKDCFMGEQKHLRHVIYIVSKSMTWAFKWKFSF